MTSAIVYRRAAESLDFFEGNVDHRLGLRDELPRRPRWMSLTDARRIRAAALGIASTLGTLQSIEAHPFPSGRSGGKL